jgi:hypothetical protein
MKKNTYLLIFFVLLVTATHAQAQKRIYVNEYLNIGVGARGLAMGGALSAHTSDVYSAYWNPAGLKHIDGKAELGLMHAEYFAGISKYDYAAAALPFNKGRSVLGVSFMRFATDNIPYTIDYVQPDGSFDDSKLKSISAGDYAMFFSFAHALNKEGSTSPWQTNIGVNGKIIFRNIGTMANAWGAGLDIGLQSTYKNRLKFGVMMKDITTSYTSWSFNLTDREKTVFYQTGNEVPIQSYELMMPRFNLGMGYHFIKPGKAFQVYGEVGFDITTDGRRNTIVQTDVVSGDPKVGLELSYKNTLFLRGGINNLYQTKDNSDTTHVQKYTTYQPSIGVGFRVKALSVDYSFTSLQMQDNPLMSHIVSLKISLSGKKNAAPVEHRNNDVPHNNSTITNQ